jgi:hypothetical protein
MTGVNMAVTPIEIGASNRAAAAAGTTLGLRCRYLYATAQGGPANVALLQHRKVRTEPVVRVRGRGGWSKKPPL